MKAITYQSYGAPAVLQYAEIEKPVPKDNQVLIRVRAASVNPLNWHFMRGTPYFIRMALGLRHPRSKRMPGDIAGRVEAIGSKVTKFAPADAVFGTSQSAFGEYVCAAESEIAAKPANVSFEQAASVPIAGLTALQVLRDAGRIQPDQHVLINGAAGGVGTFAVQIARTYGARVTGVCSTRNLEMVRSIGAHHVIDYTRENFTAGRQRYDLFIDCIGNHSLSACRRVVQPRGKYIMVGASSGHWIDPLPRYLQAIVLSPFVSQTMAGKLAKMIQADLVTIGDLVASGQVTPVIDRRYPLSEISDAMAYLEQGHARGKVVIVVNGTGEE